MMIALFYLRPVRVVPGSPRPELSWNARPAPRLLGSRARVPLPLEWTGLICDLALVQEKDGSANPAQYMRKEHQVGVPFCILPFVFQSFFPATQPKGTG